MASTAPSQNNHAFDLRAPSLFLDPHPLLHRMRAEAPVYFSPHLDSWVLTSYQDVCAALRDPRLSVVEEVKRMEALPASDQLALGALRRTFLAWGDRGNPERHALFLKLLKRHFTPHHVEAQRPRIQEILGRLLAAATRRGEMDVVNDIAHPLAMTVVAGVTGVPEEEVDLYLRCSNYISQLLEMGDRDQLFLCQRGMIELSDFLRPIVERRRRERGADLLGAFMEADPDGVHFSDDHIVAQCIMFLVVGYHTTANQLCNGLQILFDHPDARARLTADPALLPNAFDEMMRYHGAVASVRRMATVDLAIRGQQIRAGETIVLALCAANRDPSAFPDPDRLDITREEASRQVGFTIGPYSCMGQALARLEAQVFFRTLLGRFPRLRPRDAAPDWMVFRPLGRELRTLRVLFD
ncbi:cytochrome P450 [Sorangium cellulosum]|uniref:Cytochrome P450 n=1 Tax=Sorangium cellulosum TaxID=56 RepID=A0A2L0EZX2_SORCE|nr:cytochrome P450 [Sorangium cellulosum]AUX44858.1 cytochrome P450 [Sorangium cellulosum]